MVSTYGKYGKYIVPLEELIGAGWETLAVDLVVAGRRIVVAHLAHAERAHVDRGRPGIASK